MSLADILRILKDGDLMYLYEENILDTALLRLAVERGYIDVDTATSWYETLMDI